MADYPPLSRYYIASYAANDRDFPVVAIRLDPRTAGYKVPEDLSPHPDSKRYPNHVFTGAQPASGDQVVTHVYEILPAPYVPFTRYDDDLGPIQGRRRSVKNEGQQASLTADKRVTYEAREGSAIVYTEIEEEWSIKTDDDGNSLFPIRDRDFYDASRGPVQERRQLFVPTGEEEGTLENVNGVITQTSYEPYNEFLSVKVVQTYSVDGPQLVGNATNNEGQLVTVTTQRKGARNYVAPNPTATKTVEVSREDAESLVERVVDAPEIFSAQTFSIEKPDVIPVAFRAKKPSKVDEKTVGGDAEDPSLEEDEISKSEQQVTKFTKRIRTTTRENVDNVELTNEQINQFGQKVDVTRTLKRSPQSIAPSATVSGNVEDLGDDYTLKTLEKLPNVFDGLTKTSQKPDIIPEKFRVNAPINRTETILQKNNADDPQLLETEYLKTEQRLTEFTVQKSTVSRAETLNEVNSQRLEENWGINIPYKEYVSTSIPEGATIEAEGISDNQHIIREYDANKLEENLSSFVATFPTSIDLDLPRELKDIKIFWEKHKSESVQEFDSSGLIGSFKSLTQQDSGYVSSTLNLTPVFELEFKDIWGKNLPATIHLFFLKKDELTKTNIQKKSKASDHWPVFNPSSFSTTVYGVSETKSLQAEISRAIQVNNTAVGYGYQPAKGSQTSSSRKLIPVSINIPPCLTSGKTINENEELEASDLDIELKYDDVTLVVKGNSIPLTGPNITKTLEHSIEVNVKFDVPASENHTKIPTSKTYVISSSIEPYKFEWFLVRCITLDASIFA